MVIKQPRQHCQCGQDLEFPEAEIKMVCQCRAIWELNLEGRWIIRKVPFVTFLVMSRKRDLNHYQKYMLWVYRRAGSKC
jgi:hypothetical protein